MNELRKLLEMTCRVLFRHLFGGKLPKLCKFCPPPRIFGQVYNSVKNPVIVVIKRAAVNQM